ncbi:hypothetical protein TRVA0_004S02124 [Trichomonascus vanleenenianus]|uniref:post-initiation translation factor DPC29 n=1 Tax=Trichomonascus vanleenenianus TaxID=2268995 RepID=UPI003ECAB71F
MIRQAVRRFSSQRALFAGHNKWSKIKHDKAKNDGLKNATATKFAKIIAVATKVGGSPDPSINFQLATAIENASRANVAKRVIENAIKRGSGSAGGSGTNSEMAVYEGMVNGVSFVVEALTDNKARTAGQIKACFTKLSGNFSPTMFLFTKRGYIKVDAEIDAVMDKAIEAGAEDIGEVDGMAMVYTEVTETNRVVQTLKDEFTVVDFGLEYAANEDTAVPESSLDDDKQVIHEKLIANLEDLDDVIKVHSNLK